MELELELEWCGRAGWRVRGIAVAVAVPERPVVVPGAEAGVATLGFSRARRSRRRTVDSLRRIQLKLSPSFVIFVTFKNFKKTDALNYLGFVGLCWLLIGCMHPTVCM